VTQKSLEAIVPLEISQGLMEIMDVACKLQINSSRIKPSAFINQQALLEFINQLRAQPAKSTIT
jgi:hypothetical protein